MFPKKESVSLRSFVVWWNNTYPIDYWWRKKYSVPFNSEQHRRMSLLDMKFEYDEEQLFKDTYEKRRKKEEDSEYYAQTGDWLKDTEIKKMSQQDIDIAFDNLDIDALNNSNG